MLGQQRDVDDPDLALAPVQIETPGRLAVDLDDLEGGVRVVLAVPPVLGVELGAEDRVLAYTR